MEELKKEQSALSQEDLEQVAAGTDNGSEMDLMLQNLDKQDGPKAIECCPVKTVLFQNHDKQDRSEARRRK